MDSIFEQVRAISADILQISPGAITPQSSPQTIEPWDSVQHLNLLLAFEQHFNVQIDPEEMDGMTTIGAIAQLLESKVHPPGTT